MAEYLLGKTSSFSNCYIGSGVLRNREPHSTLRCPADHCNLLFIEKCYPLILPSLYYIRCLSFIKDDSLFPISLCVLQWSAVGSQFLPYSTCICTCLQLCIPFCNYIELLPNAGIGGKDTAWKLYCRQGIILHGGKEMRGNKYCWNKTNWKVQVD